MSQVSEYIPIPVGVAAGIAHSYQKQIVVIVAYSRDAGMLHTTTFGQTAVDKVDAANLGVLLAATAGGDLLKSRSYEDFRDIDAATAKETIDSLQALLNDCRLWIMSHKRGTGSLMLARIEKALGIEPAATADQPRND